MINKYKEVKLTPKEIIENFQRSSIEQIELDKKNGRSLTQSQSGAESESSKDYIGRVVFEFFQNAVDRANLNIWMELSKNKFIISNDGKPFSIYKGLKDNKKSDFYGLNNIHDGTKIAGESIGNKGVGFKSCWNVSKNVIIESILEDKPWGFELFNPVDADNFDGNNIGEKIKDAIKEIGERKVPSFYFPKSYKSKKENFKDGAVTKITINLKDDKAYEEIKEELEEFSRVNFSFLHQLEKNKDETINFNIHIKIDEKQQDTIKSRNNSWNIISLDKENTELHNELAEAREKENYINIPRNPNIAIAFPLDKINNFVANFYTYLPTKAPCGFNVLIHADFALDNARTSIPPNEYNNKILQIAAKLLVDELYNNSTLHKRSDFAKFLIPTNKDVKFAQLVWKELIKENKLTKILKKVYKIESMFPKESYELIFHAIDIWVKLQKPKTEFEWFNYRKRVYEDLIQHFCNSEIYIVPVNKDYITHIPKYSKDSNEENDSSKKLFYIAKSEIDMDFSLLKNLTSVDISGFEKINERYFTDRINLIKNFSILEIYRALSNEPKDNAKNNMDIFKFIYQWIKKNNDFDIDSVNIEYFNKDYKRKKNYPKNYLSKVMLPTKNDGWREAKQCYYEVSADVASHFINFYELDFELLKSIVTDININELKHFGVWDTIPITEKFELPWLENDLPKIDTNEFKILLQKSLVIWKKIEEISKKNIENIFTTIKNQNIFYDKINSDESNKYFLKPSEIFLFDDGIKRVGIGQERRNEKLSLLYEYLNIKTVDETRDSKKLDQQLQKLTNYELNKTHKTLYKQLTLSLSKCDDYQNIENIPLLLSDGYGNDNSNIWFADRNTKKYTHKFDLDFVLFDIETKKTFVQYFKVNLFEPEFSLKPNNAKEISNTDLKKEIEIRFLPTLFCLAEEVMHINRFNKDEAIARWNKLKIGFANDVWLEVRLNNSVEVKYIGKGLTNNDVLFKPKSYSQRQEHKDQIGELIHDLEGSRPEDIINNSKFSKFGYAIADGVFRNTAIGSVFSDFLKVSLDEDKKEFLLERGISESDLNEMISFVAQSVLTQNELNEIISIINTIPALNVDESNWFLHEFYSINDLSFIELKEKFKNNIKFQNIIEQLNPKSRNILKINNQKKDIQLKYYITNKIKLNDEEFLQKLKNVGKLLSKFKITQNEINDYFEIKEASEDERLIAQIEMEDDIKVEISDIKPSKNVKCKERKQFNTNKQTNTRKTSEEERLETSKKQQKRGLAYEKIFAIKQASKVLANNELFEVFKKQYKGILDLTKDVNFNDRSLKNIADIIQVSNTTGDGLGYDVLEIEIKDNDLKIYKVEIKSSKNNHTIHFSNNEIVEIFKMKDDDSWKLYHFVDNEVYDRTTVIKDEIKKLVKQNIDKKSNIVAESWIISFEE